jgi:hypothetical protein
MAYLNKYIYINDIIYWMGNRLFTSVSVIHVFSKAFFFLRQQQQEKENKFYCYHSNVSMVKQKMFRRGEVQSRNAKKKTFTTDKTTGNNRYAINVVF